MRINKLRLENFQGIKNAEFNFDGNSTSIYGDNATGKTTVFNAVTWLLFDKPSTGAKGYTPKTNDESGGTYHHLNHSAEGIFTLSSGRTVTLKKIYHEVYKKKRGSASDELDGHTIDYFIDGVPTGTEKEYTNTVLSFCDDSIEKMKLLTMPDFFAEGMGWEARRKILLDVCGDISDEFVIASTPELAKLKSFLLMPGTSDQFYTTDEYRKIACARKAEINKQLQDIPGRIDEVQRSMPDISGLDVSELDYKIDKLMADKTQLETKRSQATNNDLNTETIREEIALTRTRLAEARAEHMDKENQKNESTYKEISSIKKQQSNINSQVSDTETLLNKATKTLADITKKRAQLLDEYNTVQAQTWDPALEVCPTCHQTLPEGEISKLREDFNLRKGNRLEQINAKGQNEANKDMLQSGMEKIKEYQDKLNILNTTLTDLQKQERDIQCKIYTPVIFENTAIYSNIMAEITTFEETNSEIGQHILEITKNFTEKIEAIQTKIRELERCKNDIVLSQNAQKRVLELECQEKELAEQFEKLEQGVYLCECFIKAKVSLLTQNINDKFDKVSFRLFIEQQNGGIKEDCEVMVPSAGKMVPYSFANNAARINAGLEIINTLSNHWGFKMPVFIDNAESVTKLQEMDTQIIRLVVSEADKRLRTEVE